MSGKHQYVWNGGEWVDVTAWRPPKRKTPYIIRDGMDALVHPATGQRLDSKSKFREVTRAHGMVEVGNDAPTSRPKVELSRRERSLDIRDAIQQLQSGKRAPAAKKLLKGDVRRYD